MFQTEATISNYNDCDTSTPISPPNPLLNNETHLHIPLSIRAYNEKHLSICMFHLIKYTVFSKVKALF